MELCTNAMKKETESLVEEIKVYSNGLISAIEKGKIQEGLEYVKQMKKHLNEVEQYLEFKKSIPK